MITAYFDGCCEPVNPGGTASYGIVIMNGEDRVHEAHKIFQRGPTTSNNVAEYSGFIAILKWLIEHKLNHEVIIVYGDSQLVIRQMFGTWKIRDGFYVPLAKKAKQMLKEFPRIQGKWIPREENSIADELSKGALKDAGVKFRIQPEGASHGKEEGR